MVTTVKFMTARTPGADDPATPPDKLEGIAAGLPDARLLVVPRAAHLAKAQRHQPELEEDDSDDNGDDSCLLNCTHNRAPRLPNGLFITGAWSWRCGGQG